MNPKIKSMTEGSPAKLIFSFALPLMIGNIFQQMYTVVDTMVVGRALGVEALAALGASDWLNWLVLGMVQGIAQGFSIFMAQEFGAGNYTRLKKVIGNSVLLASLCSVVILAVSELSARPVLILLQTPDAIIGNALIYLRIMFIGTPIVMSYNLLASILRALGDGRTPLQAMVLAAFTNIGLDLLFVLVFHWGIPGAAIATLLAQVLSSVYCFYFIRKIQILDFTKKDFKADGNICRKLLFLGYPMAFQNAVISIGGMIVQSVVNGFGVIFIAGFTATNKLYGVLECAATSYGYSMTTYAGQNLGAGHTDRIRKGMKSAVWIAFGTSLLIAVCMLIFGKTIVGWFLSGKPDEVEAALQIAYYYLSIMSIFLPILYLLHITRSTLQGMGDTMLPMVSGIAEFIMRTGAAVLLPMLMGQSGIFYAEILAWAGADVILLSAYFYHISKWKKQVRG